MGKVVKGKNDLWTTAPDIAKLLLNPEHGYYLSKQSHKKDDFVCPFCGTISNRIVKSVTNYGFKCPVCSDGVSYPEKFVANLLKQLNIDFRHDISFEWSNSKRYDFYIKDLSLIIETHGIQHYSDDKTFFNRNDSLEKERNNDIYKRELALKNGIEKYIELDCRYSDFDYIKNSIINSELNMLLYLSNINWNSIEENCIKSKVTEVCDIYNSGIKNLSDIANIVNLHISTVTDYLKRCNKIGLCDYTPNPLHERKIICVDTGKIYDSLKYVEEDGYNKSQVSECCNKSKRAKTAGGHNWCFLDEYNPDTYIIKEPKCTGMPKRVLCIETGKIYERLIDVECDGFLKSMVSRVCNGNGNTHRGYHFKFI